jgi:hypothetical protein
MASEVCGFWEAILLGRNIVRAFWDGSAAHYAARFVDGESQGTENIRHLLSVHIFLSQDLIYFIASKLLFRFSTKL